MNCMGQSAVYYPGQGEKTSCRCDLLVSSMSSRFCSISWNYRGKQLKLMFCSRTEEKFERKLHAKGILNSWLELNGNCKTFYRFCLLYISVLQLSIEVPENPCRVGTEVNLKRRTLHFVNLSLIRLKMTLLCYCGYNFCLKSDECAHFSQVKRGG